MGTAVAIREPERPRAGLVAGREPQDFEGTLRLCQRLVGTGFLPAAIKTAEQALAVVLTGQEIGIPPMHALRSIHIIQGRPTLSAELQLALFHRAGGTSNVVESTDETCTMAFRHPNGTTHEETFTLADAKRADLLTKDMWRKYPRSMLRARAIALGLRVMAPEIVAGVYDPDELGAAIDPESGAVLGVPSLNTTAPPSPDDLPPPVSARVTDTETAQAFPLPFKKSPSFGKPLGEIPSDGLRTIAAWVEEKRQEHGNPSMFVDLTDAIALVLADREKDAETPAAAEPAADPANTHPESRYARVKRINALIEHPACLHLRDQARRELVNGMSDDRLATTVATLEGLVAGPHGAPSSAGGDGGDLGLGDARRPVGQNAVVAGH